MNVFFGRCFGRFGAQIDAKMEPNWDQSRSQHGHEHEKASIAETVASEARERHSEDSRRPVSERKLMKKP